ncbi:hypothetical protein Taro_048325 [Colocasia esculenta]|uniref:Uncharacterized protein n=1 Tax=Colocasia esculenta TaxID=4460 RepID=A0A843WY34_COLES|nr:hypothetical protein [Colocasia esculenta]
MAEVRFRPQIVRDHARYGYLAVPTRFGSFPPVVEFPNFLGVAFVNILHQEARAEAKVTVKEISCQVHHMNRGNGRNNKRPRGHQASAGKTQALQPVKRQHDKDNETNAKGTIGVDHLAPTPPVPVFKSYARQGTIFCYTAYHNKAANLERLAHMPLLQRRGSIFVPSFMQAANEVNLTMSSHFYDLAKPSLEAAQGFPRPFPTISPLISSSSSPNPSLPPPGLKIRSVSDDLAAPRLRSLHSPFPSTILTLLLEMAPKTKILTRRRRASTDSGESSRAPSERRSKHHEDRLPELIVPQGLHLIQVKGTFKKLVQSRCTSMKDGALKR